jgi:hypothetical protein
VDHDQCQVSVELKAKFEAMLRDYERRNTEMLMLWQTCDQLGRDMVEVKTLLKGQNEAMGKLATHVETHVVESVDRIKKIEELDQFKKAATWGLCVIFTAIVGVIIELIKR